MNNQELELKIKEVLSIENFFDMIEKAVEFEKEYKTTTFYKKTKMSLAEVLKLSKTWYALQLNDLGKTIQKIINELDFENVNKLISQFGELYNQENNDILDMIKEFKDIVK